MSNEGHCLKLCQVAYLGLGPLSLSVNLGECLGVSGESGSGKTLLLRLIADLDPHEGEVFLEGIEQKNISPVLWRQQVAWVSAESAWWADDVGSHFQDWLASGYADLGFKEESQSWEIARLSTGEKQRLGLLRALENKPKVLLLDEPTSALDEVNRQRVESLIARLKQDKNMAVVWVSHDQAQLERVADVRVNIVNKALGSVGF